MLCQYKNVLGKPGQGIHSIRFAGIAVVDLVLTIIGAWIISKKTPYLSFINIFLLLIVAGIVLHKIFCVETAFNRFLGLN